MPGNWTEGECLDWPDDYPALPIRESFLAQLDTIQAVILVKSWRKIGRGCLPYPVHSDRHQALTELISVLIDGEDARDFLLQLARHRRKESQTELS